MKQLVKMKAPRSHSWLRRLPSLLFLVLGALLLRPAVGAAQEIGPADSAAVVLETARDFEERGRTDLAEALYQHILDRYPDTPSAATVRNRFAGDERRDRVRFEEDGDVELLVWSTLYGGWLGVAVPQMAGADDPETYGLGLLIGAPLGFLTARAYGSGRVVTDGHARAVTLGGSWGTWQGLGWAQVFELGSDCYRTGTGQRVCEDSPSVEATFASMVAGGVLGIGVGGYLANRTDVTAGTSTLANVGALWGSGFGLAAGLLAGTDEADTLWALALAGGNLGLASMALLGPRWEVSRGRARLISVGGLVGLLGGLGFDLLLQPESTRVGTLIPTVTTTAGLAVGAYATRGMDDDPGREASASPLHDGSLVRWRNGGLTLDVPAAGLTLRPAPPHEARGLMHRADSGGGATHRLALRVNLFSAHF